MKIGAAQQIGVDGSAYSEKIGGMCLTLAHTVPGFCLIEDTHAGQSAAMVSFRGYGCSLRTGTSGMAACLGANCWHQSGGGSGPVWQSSPDRGELHDLQDRRNYTAGGLFVIEQANRVKGGPPRHLHHEQDELWYVLAGDYVVEIGSERHLLKPGDCILGPRRIPHAWAFVGDSPGKLLIAFTPAGKMQENFERDRRAGEYRSDAETFRAYGMELVGPPLSIK
jgi:quercetin dioxygenase-like cupin family protein